MSVPFSWGQFACRGQVGDDDEDSLLVRKWEYCLVEGGVRDGLCRVLVVRLWTVRLSGSEESVLLRLSFGSCRGAGRDVVLLLNGETGNDDVGVTVRDGGCRRVDSSLGAGVVGQGDRQQQ